MKAARALWQQGWPPLVVLAVGVGLWHAAVGAFEIKPYVLPTPGAVVEEVWRWDATDDGGGNVLWAATLQTGYASAAGLGLSLVLGTLAALAFAGVGFLRRGLYPYTIFFQTVPVVAIAPLIVLWLGTGFRSVVIVAFVISVFPVISNATQGLTRVDSGLLELFESYGASRWQLLVKLRLPAAVPYVVAGARVASGLAVIGAIVGEFFVGHSTEHYGLGYLISATSANLKTARLFGAIGASTALGLALFAGVGTIGGVVLARWSPEQTEH